MATDHNVSGRLLAEAAAMMQRMVFSTASGGSLCGERVQTVADPRWDDDVQAYRLLLQCYAPGYDSRVWAGMPVVLRAVDDDTPRYVTRLDGRGRAVVPALPQGEYGLRTSATWIAVEIPAAHSATRFGSGLSDASSAPVAGGPSVFGMPSAQGEPMRFAAQNEQTYISNDERLRCTVRQTSGWLYLNFESVAETLAAARTYFAFADAAGRIRHDGEVHLSPTGEAGRGRAHWGGSVELTEPVTLICLAWPAEE